MYKLRLALLLLFLSYASGEAANKPDDIKTPATTSVARTPNGKDNASTTAKSKTEKRDSADQTGTPAVQRIKDEPFRPIYQPAQYQQEAAAAVSAAFQPTTVRYVAAETVPQAYYEKALDAAALGGRSGIQYASSAYRGPFNPSYQPLSQSQPQQQQQQLHKQQQQQQLPREQQQQRQQQNSYAYAEPDAHYTHESETPQPHQQYQHQQQQQQQHYNQQLQQYAQQQLYAYYALQKQQQQSRPQPPSLPPPPPPPQALQRQPHQQHPPQQQVHYIIAIPLSYMRQLQQQLAPAHEAPLAYGQPTPNAHARPLPRPQPLVLLQPVAREQHQLQPLAYQPPLLQYSAADAAPPPPAAHTAYSSQFIPLPANLLFAASAGRLPPADYHLQRSPVFQPLFYGQPQHVRQQQLQQPQQQHNSNVQLAHPPEEPYAQQQQQPAPYQHIQQQQQQQKQQKQANVVRIGGTKPSTKLISTPSPALEPPVAPAAAAIATATPPHLSPQAAAALSPAASPLVHYNPAYAQPAPAAEQPAGAIANYAPYAQGQYSGLPHATLVKLSAPSALLAPTPHYYTLPHHPLAAPKLSAAPSSYIVRANPYAAQEPGAALRLPYFMQAGGIHYGTHLYHPPTPTTSAKAAANGPQQQQQQHSVAAGGAGDDSAKIVKYP